MTDNDDRSARYDHSGAVLTVSVGSGEGKQFFLNRRLNSIGKDEKNTVCVSGKKVRANHACILFKKGTYALKNLGKPAATCVNDAPVKSECTLSTGDRITIGEVEFRFVASQLELVKDSNESGREKMLSDFVKDRAEAQLLETFSSLIDITAALLAENDVSRVVARLVEVIARVMQCDGVRVLMADGEKNLRTIVVFPFNSDENSYSRTAIEHAGNENRTVLVSDIESDHSLPAQESMMLKDIRSILCAPLKGDDNEKIGYLYLDRLKGQKTFVDTDRDFFERLRSLFGNILLITRTDIFLVLALDLLVVGVVALFYNVFLAICFDDEFAGLRGIHTHWFYLVLLCLTALTIVLLVRVVGIVMVIALLTLPAAIAGNFASSIKQMMILSVLLCGVFILSGLSTSYTLDLPSGPVIIVIAAGVYLTVVVGTKLFARRRA